MFDVVYRYAANQITVYPSTNAVDGGQFNKEEFISQLAKHATKVNHVIREPGDENEYFTLQGTNNPSFTQGVYISVGGLCCIDGYYISLQTKDDPKEDSISWGNWTGTSGYFGLMIQKDEAGHLQADTKDDVAGDWVCNAVVAFKADTLSDLEDVDERNYLLLGGFTSKNPQGVFNDNKKYYIYSINEDFDTTRLTTNLLTVISDDEEDQSRVEITNNKIKFFGDLSSTEITENKIKTETMDATQVTTFMVSRGENIRKGYPVFINNSGLAIGSMPTTVSTTNPITYVGVAVSDNNLYNVDVAYSGLVSCKSRIGSTDPDKAIDHYVGDRLQVGYLDTTSRAFAFANEGSHPETSQSLFTHYVSLPSGDPTEDYIESFIVEPIALGEITSTESFGSETSALNAIGINSNSIDIHSINNFKFILDPTTELSSNPTPYTITTLGSERQSLTSLKLTYQTSNYPTSFLTGITPSNYFWESLFTHAGKYTIILQNLAHGGGTWEVKDLFNNIIVKEATYQELLNAGFRFNYAAIDLGAEIYLQIGKWEYVDEDYPDELKAQSLIDNGLVKNSPYIMSYENNKIKMTSAQGASADSEIEVKSLIIPKQLKITSEPVSS